MTAPEELPAPIVLPCGCLLTYAIEDGLRVVKVSACNRRCDNLALILAEAEMRGKPIEERKL